MLTTFMCRLLPLIWLIQPSQNKTYVFQKEPFQTEYELMLNLPDLTLKVSIKTLTFQSV